MQRRRQSDSEVLLDELSTLGASGSDSTRMGRTGKPGGTSVGASACNLERIISTYVSRVSTRSLKPLHSLWSLRLSPCSWE